MANQILTPRMILREAYAIAHQKSNFIMRVNRQYDDRFARRGAKIGQKLDVRLPAKYVTREGNAMQTQAHVERAVELPLATIMGVDLEFGQEELTFSLDDFSDRVLKPAVSQLIADVEHRALSILYRTVANSAGAVDDRVDFWGFQQAGQRITEQLAPLSDRTMCFQPAARVQFSDAVKGLFQSSDNIRDQYVEGVLGRTGGFDCYENTIVPSHVVGPLGGTPLVAGAGQGNPGTDNAYVATTDLVTDGWTAAAAKRLSAGDIITIAGVYDVHPETKQPYAHLKQFTVVEDASSDESGDAVVTIAPAIITGGAYQNVSAAPADNAAITVLGTANTAYGQSLAFHRDAFAFVTADLEDASQYGAWGGREVMDGLSMRIWRQGNIDQGTFPCRLDIAFGVAAIYPEWATRLVYDPAWKPSS